MNTELPSQPKPSSLLPVLIKADRLAGWVLFFVILGFAITGFGMTKGFLDSAFAQSLHFRVLSAVGIVAFIIHTSWGMRLALVRRQWWNTWTKISVLALYVLIVCGFGYLQFFYQPARGPVPAPQPPIAESASPSANAAAPTVFTADALKAFNGLDGQPAYVAVDGVVYDASRVFQNGKHGGGRVTAGLEQSAAFHSKHAAKILESLPVMGTYQP
ncbi:MAG: hypothetical protein WCV84_01220 [Patescibacteria group bacterium]